MNHNFFTKFYKQSKLVAPGKPERHSGVPEPARGTTLRQEAGLGGFFRSSPFWFYAECMRPTANAEFATSGQAVGSLWRAGQGGAGAQAWG